MQVSVPIRKHSRWCFIFTHCVFTLR